jgi:hypothetical protein
MGVDECAEDCCCKAACPDDCPFRTNGLVKDACPDDCPLKGEDTW